MRAVRPMLIVAVFASACGGLVDPQPSSSPDAGSFAPPDAGTTSCTSHRDCMATNNPVCDPATGKCINTGLMPCETDSDCATYYNTSFKKCSPAKVCAPPCPLEVGSAYASTCPDQMRSCSFQGICQCTTDAKCGGGLSVCGQISKMCQGKCSTDAHCAALAGTVCDAASGQCVTP